MGTLGRTFKMIRTAIILLLVSILVQTTLLDDTIQDNLKKVGDAIQDNAEKVGDALQDNAEKVGDALTDNLENAGNEIKNQLTSSSGERGMSLYCGVLLALVIFFK